MPVECYAKVDFAHRRLKFPGIRYSPGIMWFCRLMIVEHNDFKERSKFLSRLLYVPGFRWKVVERGADITWYENAGGMFDWEDVSEVCSFLSQDVKDEDAYIPILPFETCINGQELLVSNAELLHIFPECFQDENVMPTDLLADYIRDRLGSSL
jgi:hypothetical protein